MNLSEIRTEYKQKSLEKNAVDANPINQLELWLNEAKEANCPEYTAMTVATSNENGQPSIRIVLLKYVKDDALYFFTNYRSRKGKDLAINNKIAAHFFWPELERQVKIEGLVHKAAPEISDFYFNSRPHESQISAVISNQSAEVADRRTLENLWEKEAKKWEGVEIERPDYWGGYQIKPTRIEFWQGRPFRLHDRLAYQKSIDGWRIKRLAP
ncbi:MAG: pyridoxamine 5'-phosphate oxidase [Prolixibacteraceae bacterium]|jgi:pyridoxamine 5'-phosphate oxidase|nr:pyridoxamine 5'-phosphate oxidase [Prolixibacteraceae bacterium]